LTFGRGGAIILDNKVAYEHIIKQRYDGRDLSIKPWHEQEVFEVGYHYKPTIEDAELGLKLLSNYKPVDKKLVYPDLRNITIGRRT
jgi:dTDP-4-amino-4,6-dideoxygalactose transaminase